MPLAAAGMKTKMLRQSLFALLAAGHAAVAAPAASSPQHCVHPAVVLWGDGRHDDTRSLQAWLHGAAALWGDSGAPIGATIAWHEFRLSAAIYVDAGTGRTLQNFRLVWPERGETVIGGIQIVGGDAGEGIPIERPDAPLPPRSDKASCGIS
jgi:hypothetical protein